MGVEVGGMVEDIGEVDLIIDFYKYKWIVLCFVRGLWGFRNVVN